jgi:hypothetical protein
MDAAVSRRLVVVCPLEFERRGLLRAGVSAFADVACCGPGAAGVRAWSLGFQNNDRPVVLAGLAGALNPGIRMGSAFAIGEVIKVESGARWRAHLGDRGDDLKTAVSVPATLTNPDSKQEVYRATQADIVDLESASFAQIASDRSWRWGVVRGVSDSHSDHLPANIDSWVHSDGTTRLPVVLGAILMHPSALFAANRLRRAGAAALKSVAVLLQSLARAEGGA